MRVKVQDGILRNATHRTSGVVVKAGGASITGPWVWGQPRVRETLIYGSDIPPEIVIEI